MGPAMAQMHQRSEYMKAELIASRAAASKMAFIIDGNEDEYKGEEDSSGNKLMDVEPGGIEQLSKGSEVKAIDWNHPNESFAPFLITCLRGEASALGVSYNTYANDMASVNFASGQLGLDEERQTWRGAQNWFIESFCQPVFAAWLEMALLTGEVPLPFAKFNKFNSPQFRGRRWEYVNPQREVTAQLARLGAGLTSISKILAEQDIDRDELFDEIQQDMEAARARGIPLSYVIDMLKLQAQNAVDASQMG